MNQSQVSATEGEPPVYLVIGATGGVGSDLCLRLFKREARVILAARCKDEVSSLAKNHAAESLICDVTDFSQIKECIESAGRIFGRLDGVALCVGSLLLKPAHLTTEEEWSSVIALNLSAAFATVKYAAKAMMGNGGSIVLVSSCAARVGLPNHEAIAAAKAGVEGLARSAAATYARHQIRVNCVAPGLLNTKMARSITANEIQLQASKDMHPLSRIGEASDVSNVMDWLLSAESFWVTGQSIAIDGGLSSLRSARPQRQLSK
jgi:NAD(P)-dependent dehydrogenase (short-subunit alcohol dehydrogenase family)